MKKVISLFLALIMILSIGTVGVSAVSEETLWIYASTKHARIGDYVYYPVYYEAKVPYETYIDSDGEAVTRVVFPFDYDPEVLKPVEVTPSELLYGMEFEGKVTEVHEDYVWTTPDNYDMTWSFFYVEIKFKGYEGIKDGEILFNVKCEVVNDEFYNTSGSVKYVFDSGLVVIGDDINDWKNCIWEVTDSVGEVFDFSSKVDYNYRASFEPDNEIVLEGYEPFIPPVEEDNMQLKVGESIQVSLAADEVILYSFIPEQSGNYKISVEGGVRSLVDAEIYRADSPENILDKGITMTTDVTGYVGIVKPQMMMSLLKTSETSLVYLNARANDEIILKLSDGTSECREMEKQYTVLKGLTDCFIPSVVTITVEATELTSIVPGETYTVSREEVFEFTPEDSGEYRFTSELTGGAKPEIKICDYSGVVATSSGFDTASVSDSLDFDVTAELQAGETYLVHCNNTAVNNDNQSVGTFGVEVEDMTVEADITNVTYTQKEDTHKVFTVTANGRKTMIQFIEPDGGTRTYDRYNKNVKITSYNADGEVVNAMARDLAYEVWEIYSNMSVGVEINVRGKESGKWDEVKYSFTIEPYNPIISMELSSTSGKKGPIPATVVVDEKTEKVMFKMPNNTSVTISNYTTDENGNRVFTGKAWMNEDGLNEIRVFIYRNNVWRQVGTLEYTVE